MSLDVYLYTDTSSFPIAADYLQDGGFVREAEFLRTYMAMELYSANITHNLGRMAEASAGKITSTTLSKVAANDVWRLVLDVETDGQPLIELKASVAADGRPMTETWLYQWRGAAA